ncbi:phosphate ABC transporter ATP-binding protein [Synechococcus elongatus]|uniref:Phosphate ABC transporter ATP-binding protein n=2 Tax=Synechococcus elongatus TaxID=32046 RepID=A0AAN1UV87_SYNEL|nr:phosphate ABC transporter ATP-binding protein [Synechococcus elongatus]AZB73370.1 phosphate ABC transporter ATP-binding protein [Synechococcus elongatus PCC 11801]
MEFLPPPPRFPDPALRLDGVSVHRGDRCLLHQISCDFPKQTVTAIVGPSGCGKTLLLRCLNRLSDLQSELQVSGHIWHQGRDLRDRRVDVESLRCQLSLIRGPATPIAGSLYDNLVLPARLQGYSGNFESLAREVLALVDLPADLDLQQPARYCSPETQLRLCLARAIAMEPDILLLDEPCVQLDSAATLALEELLLRLCDRYTILLVTNSLAQAGRCATYTALLHPLPISGQASPVTTLIEFASTSQIFRQPQHPITDDFVCGRR